MFQFLAHLQRAKADYERRGSCHQWPAYKETEKEGQRGTCVRQNGLLVTLFIRTLIKSH